MDKRGSKLGRILRISIVLIGILLGIFAEGSSVQAQPTIDLQTPADGSVNNLINTTIKIQFNMTMNTSPVASSIQVWDEYGQNVAGAIPAIQWTTTTKTDDTLVFTPQNGLKPATGYSYEGSAQSATGSAWFRASFLTKYSMADATPPTVQTTYPYSNKTGVRTGESIYIKFSEAMNPTSITTPGNITLTGDGIGGTGDYIVMYSIEDGGTEIRKATPFTASSQYTVTVTTNVRDLRGNPLKTEYSWSFWAGAADLTPPTVTQTIPADGDDKVSLYPTICAIFSEEMKESTFLAFTNITLRDNTASKDVPINIYSRNQDNVSFGPQSALTYGNNYTVTIGTEVKDSAGNGVSPAYTWSFTTAINSTIDRDPIINWGLSRDDQIGQRFSDGINPSITKVSLGLGAWDDVTNPLTVAAAIPGYGSRNLTGSPSEFGGYDYKYNSPGNESLSAGNYTVTFTIKDGATPQNTVTFQRDIYIFGASPTLSSPSNGATGVSTTPTFTWSYSASPRPLHYNVAVFDGPDMDTAPMVWMGVMVDQGSGTHSITIPVDKKLTPNKTYYWGVRGVNREENGETFFGLRPFTTGGTPPPPPHFAWTYVRSEDIYPPDIQGRLTVKVYGPSPADIVELKVTGPDQFQYIFTEDDISRSEQLGQYYTHNFPNLFSDGTYTFSLTDSAGRNLTATKDFTYAFVPRVTTMSPADNTYVNTTTPTLSWNSVPGANYYRVLIMDWNGNQAPVYDSDFIQDTSIIVPSGYLLSNTPYKWRVDVFDAPLPNGNNSSRSNTLQFSTGSSSGPAADINWVQFFNENSHYAGPMKSISAGVLYILPNQVTSFNVSGSDVNYDFQQNNIMYNLAGAVPQGSMYTYSILGAAAGGDYNFNLQTSRGDDTSLKNLTPTVIPIVNQATMSPANNAYLTNLTPTFSWTTVGGSYYYRIFIMDWRSRFLIYASNRTLNQTSFTLPAGILKPNMSYMWRVEVYDGSTMDADNRSTSGWNCFTTPRPTLVDHYYTSILKRTPDPGGKAYWEGEVERTQTLGIDIKEAYMVMSGNFFNSAEYLGFGRSNEEFLTDLYLTFFNRDPDPGGLSYWLGELSSGSYRDMVMYFFMFSPEFYDFMSELFGDTTTRAEIYPVVDFYRGFMNRLPDDVGFAYWLNRFRTAQCVGAAAVTAEADAISSLFLSSDEYIGRGRTNAQYVQDLYYAFMRRYASAGEVGYWVGELNTGAKTREWLRLFFLASPEFQARVDAMIAQGCL